MSRARILIGGFPTGAIALIERQDVLREQPCHEQYRAADQNHRAERTERIAYRPVGIELTSEQRGHVVHGEPSRGSSVFVLRWLAPEHQAVALDLHRTTKRMIFT